MLFPTISFSASGGVQSSSLGTLLHASSGVFALDPLVNFLGPILNGAQYRHQYEAQKALYQSQVAAYRGTVLNALMEVSNALVAVRTYREQREQLAEEVGKQRERVRLAMLRFRAGVAAYLDVVQAEQNLYAAELLLAQTMGAEFDSTAQLFRALGGGWKVPDSLPRAAVSYRRGE
jgi:outer membrane protein TolC